MLAHWNQATGSEVQDLIDQRIPSTHTVVKYQKVNDLLLEHFEKLNAERREADLVELKSYSYRLIVNSFKIDRNDLKG